MPKNNTNKQPKRSPAKRVLRSVAQAATTLLDPEHENTLVGLIDPFSDESARAKYPDAGAGSTLCQKSLASFTGTTNANGAYAFSVDANFSFPVTYASTIASTTVTWTATKYVDWSTTLLATNAVIARPTSIGVRIVNTLSATDSSGYIVIAKGGPAVLGGTTTFDPLNFVTYDVYPFTHGGEWTVTLKPTSSWAYTMISPSTYVTNTSPPLSGWEVCYIGLFGSKASSTPMLVEIVSNFEYAPKEDSAIASLASPQPVLNIPMQTAVNQVMSDHSGHHVGGLSGHKAKVKQLAKKALVKHVLPFAVRKAKQALF